MMRESLSSSGLLVPAGSTMAADRISLYGGSVRQCSADQAKMELDAVVCFHSMV
jgi:hypothetical protein